MSVGILLLTHPGIGAALCAVAEVLLRRLPLPVEVVEVPFDGDPQALLPVASAALRRVDGGAGVLVLTDLYGASPSNLAVRLMHLGTPVRLVSGVNLPMLLRAMNYPELALDALADAAGAGARNSVIHDAP